jgi:hypothetical protein
MPDRYKNLLLAAQTVLLCVLTGYLALHEPPQSAPVPLAPTTQPAEVDNEAEQTQDPGTVDMAARAVARQIAAQTKTEHTTPATDPQIELRQKQQMWQHYLTEQVDYDWSERYQQQLSDYFVTEAPLHSFKASKIQCRQTSCMLQITSPGGDTAEQQLKLAHALNPLREQGKIGVYLISQSDGDTVQLMIAKPEEPEQLLH